LIDGMGQHRRGAGRWSYVVDEPLPHVWISQPAYDFAEGVYDEGFGDDKQAVATHSRKLLFIKPGQKSSMSGYWIIHDRILPTDENNHTYETLFHLNAEAEDISVVSERNTVWTRSEDTANILLQSAGTSATSTTRVLSGQLEPTLRGWKRASQGAAPIPVASFLSEGAGPQNRLFLLYPVPKGSPTPKVSFSRSRTDGTTLGTIEFGNGETHLVGFSDDAHSKLIGYGEETVSGHAFWIAKDTVD